MLNLHKNKYLIKYDESEYKCLKICMLKLILHTKFFNINYHKICKIIIARI